MEDGRAVDPRGEAVLPPLGLQGEALDPRGILPGRRRDRRATTRMAVAAELPKPEPDGQAATRRR